jgi:hypothetical protein
MDMGFAMSTKFCHPDERILPLTADGSGGKHKRFSFSRGSNRLSLKHITSHYYFVYADLVNANMNSVASID